MTAALLRMNKGSWDGMGSDHRKIFTHVPSDSRRGFVEKAAALFSGRPVTGITSLLDYETKRPDSMVGSYRVTYDDGTTLVIHAKQYLHPETYDLSNNVYAFYNASGISAAQLHPTVNGYYHGNVDGLSVYATPNIAGRHPDRIADVFHVAATLARVQEVNKNLPEPIVLKIQNNAKTTLDWFESGTRYFESTDGQSALAEAGITEPKDVAFLKGCVETYKKSLSHMAVSSNDMIPGNLLIDDQGNVTLLDFDNIGASWMPYGTDIGLAAYRIALDFAKNENGEADDALAIKTFCEGFNSAATEGRKINTQTLQKMAITGNVTKLLSVLHQSSQGQPRTESIGRFAGMLFQIRDRFSPSI